MKNKINTGLKDKNGVEIKSGDWVSLNGNMTADNSMGLLPNGWTFDETDVYEVYFDERINHWSLKTGYEPDSPYNIKFLNHCLSLLHDKMVEIVDEPEVKKEPESKERQDFINQMISSSNDVGLTVALNYDKIIEKILKRKRDDL